MFPRADLPLVALIVGVMAAMAQPAWAQPDNPDVEAVSAPGPGVTYTNYTCVTTNCAGVRMLGPGGTLAGCTYIKTGPTPACTGICTYCSGPGTVNACKTHLNETCIYPANASVTNCGTDFTNPCVYSLNPKAPNQPCWCSNTLGAPGAGSLCSAVSNCI